MAVAEVEPRVPVAVAMVNGAQARPFPLADHPRLRPIEVFPIDDRGERRLVLRDPSDPDLRPLVLSNGAGELLMLLDGQRTVDGVSAALRLRGAPITPTQVRRSSSDWTRPGSSKDRAPSTASVNDSNAFARRQRASRSMLEAPIRMDRRSYRGFLARGTFTRMDRARCLVRVTFRLIRPLA